MHIFDLTRRLIEIESITGAEEDIGNFLRDYLAELKYEVSLQKVTSHRFNVFAAAGQPDVVFSTHIDTVPPYLPFNEDESYIHGRGACDAKGILAAQVEAAERLRAAGENRLGLLFVVGEERGGSGAKMANKHPAGSKFLINGEPTDNKLAIGSKGCLCLEVSTRGIAAHSAYPQVGDSAILKLLDVLGDIRGMKFEPHPVLGETTLSIGVLEAGSKANVVPDRARAEIMMRLVEPAANVKARLETLAGSRAEIAYLFEAPVVMMNLVEGFESVVVSFSSDVPLLTRWGEPFLIGPGSILDAHSDHDRIRKQELLDGADLYVLLAGKLLAR
jgi:acetylornithine deacetylase